MRVGSVTVTVVYIAAQSGPYPIDVQSFAMIYGVSK